MSPDTIHLSLITALAIGLGAAMTHGLWSNPAAGYPAGSAVSAGSNPVVAQGGRVGYSGSSETVFTAPADQNIVVTDVVLTGASTSGDCYGQVGVILSTPSASNLAHFSVDDRTYAQSTSTVVTAHYQSGLPVLAGESLTIRSSGNFRTCGPDFYAVDYSISGYLAQP